MNIALILAGGIGARMGDSVPKQFIKVLNKPIIVYTLERFERHTGIDAVEVVCLESYIGQIQELIQEYHLQKVRWVVPGGDTFQNSVRNGIFALRTVCGDDDIVMVHMSVAPFIEDDIITDGLRVCRENGNAISANPCLLCMGTRDNDRYSTQSIDRDTLIGFNTPQTFLYGGLRDAYDEAIARGILDRLEPHITSLLHERGEKLYFSKGSQMNIKITTRDDLELFEAYCIMKERKRNKEEGQ